MKNKEIVSMCKNFYKIVNFEIMEGDNITATLIKIYQEYIFNIDINNKEDVDSIIALDTILGHYIEDHIFRRELQKEIVKIKVRRNPKTMLRDIINNIIAIFNNYQEYTTKVVCISRWI